MSLKATGRQGFRTLRISYDESQLGRRIGALVTSAHSDAFDGTSSSKTVNERVESKSAPPRQHRADHHGERSEARPTSTAAVAVAATPATTGAKESLPDCTGFETKKSKVAFWDGMWHGL
mmetsp:Transcript_61042/g.155086  ORF Transcript_61042/g.155086 Transcript_61042/m.155086 type:complete len:120 (-) Transcript_61042:938-1297(-)